LIFLKAIRYIRQIGHALIRKQPSDDPGLGFLVGSSLKLLVLHVLSLAFGFLLNYLLVKTVDLPEYGTYVFIFNLLNLLVSFCLFGTDTLLVKMAAIYDANGRVQELKGVLIFSFITVLAGSLITSILSTKGLQLLNTNEGLAKVNWLALSIPALIMLSAMSVNQACLQGLRKMIQSQVAEKIVKPLLMMAVVVFLFYTKRKISLPELIWLNLASIGLALLLSFYFLKTNLCSLFKQVTFELKLGSWLKSAAAFFAMNVFYAINSRVDIFLLGALKGNEAVGVYNVVSKLSELNGFVLSVFNFALAPLAAQLYKHGELKKLQRLITGSAQVVLAGSLPLLVLFVIFRKEVLLFFGPAFLTGQHAFVILCLGQLLNVLFGSVGTLLLMSGNQKFSVLSLAISLLCNVLLNLLLTPRYGIAGTAMATASSLGLWNLLMYFFVRKKINLRTTAFGVA
jgi:O-antigen/teichoic acid export membrane protein